MAACSKTASISTETKNQVTALASTEISNDEVAAVEDVSENSAESSDGNSSTEEEAMELIINGTKRKVNWENNKAVKEITAYAKNNGIIVQTSIYGGFEQVGSLPQSFSAEDVQMTTQAGDIVLYAGNQIVLFFGSNSWRYTKLGHIEGLSSDELSELLGGSTATIELN